MSSMKKTYGSDKKAKEVFYATANAKGAKPGERFSKLAKGK